MKCDYCSKEIETSELDDYPVHDESGSYHAECYDKITQEEMNYWLARYKSEHQAVASSAVDEADGYDWGDPKNPAYMEWVLEQADTR